MACTHCPFAFTDESDYVQGLGCLPSPWDIIQMKRKSGHNWACHSNEKTICNGFVEHIDWMKENSFQKEKYSDINTSVGGLISYETWYHEGEEAALEKANET